MWPFSSWDPKISWMILWIEFIFCMLTVMQKVLVRPTLYSISLTFKCQFTAVLLVRTPGGSCIRILWIRVSPSLPPDICLVVLLKLDHSISLNFGVVPETLKKLCISTRFRGKTFFAPKIGEMSQKRPKIGFFDFNKKFGH